MNIKLFYLVVLASAINGCSTQSRDNVPKVSEEKTKAPEKNTSQEFTIVKSWHPVKGQKNKTAISEMVFEFTPQGQCHVHYAGRKTTFPYTVSANGKSFSLIEASGREEKVEIISLSENKMTTVMKGLGSMRGTIELESK